MTGLVIGETFLLALLSVLVVGLLRSHADIQARLEQLRRDRRPGGGELSPHVPPPPERGTAPAATPIAGRTLSGDAFHVSFDAGGPNTLLAFLTTGCSTCQRFWDAFGDSAGRDLPADARLIIVAKDPSQESSSRLARVAPSGVPLAMSSDVWDSYDVPGAPYFVYIDGAAGTVLGEGSAEHWDQVLSLLTDAIYDYDVARAQAGAPGAAGERPPGVESAAERARRAEAALIQAGIPLDDPSLFSTPTPEKQ
jgi:hypothetical protein